MIRTKFVCESVTHRANGSTLTLMPVTHGSKENEKFFKYTPSGILEIGTINSEAIKQFVPGKEYYIDIQPADAETPPTNV